MRNPLYVIALTVGLVACGDGTLVVDDNPHAGGSSMSGNNSSTTTGSMPQQTNAPPVNSNTPDPTSTNNSTSPPSTNNGTGAGTNNQTSTNNMTVPPTNNMTPGEQFHPMFVAVADFMREKCVNCHDQGQNGNIIVPSADVSNADLRVNLEGVVATTGRLLIEPNDPAESQVYIMITNSAGEQFPPETIAIVEDWINAGAPYDP